MAKGVNNAENPPEVEERSPERSYFGNFLNLIAYGFSSIFGRVTRGIFGMLGSRFTAQIEADPNGIRGQIASGDHVDSAKKKKQKTKTGNTKIRLNRKETNNCKVIIKEKFIGDPKKPATNGKNFNMDLKATGEASGSTYRHTKTTNIGRDVPQTNNDSSESSDSS